jgi:hypothetical protein
MKLRSVLLQLLIMFAAVGSSYPAELNQEALAAWKKYIAEVQLHRPTLIKAELLDSNGDEQKFSILWVQRVLLVTAAFYTELDSNYVAQPVVPSISVR